MKPNAESLAYLSKKLDGKGIFYMPSAANFLMADMKSDAETIFKELLKEGYIARSGKPFGMNTYTRVSAGSIKQMERFIYKVKGGGLA